MSEERPICQYCLADPRYTKIAEDKERRCPVCGADYTGPRRDAEMAAIREANQMWLDDVAPLTPAIQVDSDYGSRGPSKLIDRLIVFALVFALIVIAVIFIGDAGRFF